MVCALFVFISLQSADNNELIKDDSSYNKTRLVVKIIAGVGLATLAHVASEYLVLNAHEHGHCIGRKITDGEYGQVTIKSNLSNGPLAVLFPFSGYAVGKGGNKAVSSAMGPACGILASYGFMALVEGVCAALERNSAKNIAKRALTQPIALYPSIAHGAKEIVTGQALDNISVSKVFSTTFSFFKMSRIIGEIIYGFTPYQFRIRENSDGVTLWREFYPSIRSIQGNPAQLIAVSASPAVIALGAGLITGIYKRLSS